MPARHSMLPLPGVLVCDKEQQVMAIFKPSAKYSWLLNNRRKRGVNSCIIYSRFLPMCEFNQPQTLEYCNIYYWKTSQYMQTCAAKTWVGQTVDKNILRMKRTLLKSWTHTWRLLHTPLKLDLHWSIKMSNHICKQYKKNLKPELTREIVKNLYYSLCSKLKAIKISKKKKRIS